MNDIPTEIHLHIISYCYFGKDAFSIVRVSHKWRNLMAVYVLQKNSTFEDCIIDSDYYQFKKYLDVKATGYQLDLIRVVGDKVFMNHFGIDEPIGLKFMVGELLYSYSKIGHLRVVQYLVKILKKWNEKFYHISSVVDHVSYAINRALAWSVLNEPNQENPKKHLEIVQYLVDNGADIHYNKDYALKWSAYYGDHLIVKYLVEKGADTSILPKELCDKYNLSCNEKNSKSINKAAIELQDLIEYYFEKTEDVNDNVSVHQIYDEIMFDYRDNYIRPIIRKDVRNHLKKYMLTFNELTDKLTFYRMKKIRPEKPW